MHIRGAVFAWVCMVILAAAPLYAEPQQVKVLYRKQLPKNGELVIAQQPLVRGNAFRELLGTRAPAELGASAFALVCELHSPGQPPLLLYSHVYPCWKESDYAGFEVLDVMVRPGHIVFVVADAWSDIALIEIGELAHCRIGGPPPAEWSLLGASVPTRPGRLRAKLAYDATRQSVEVEITDSLEGSIQRTLFRQNRDEWKFEKVRQWQEK